jgi:gliding motility-associated-like protein
MPGHPFFFGFARNFPAFGVFLRRLQFLRIYLIFLLFHPFTAFSQCSGVINSFPAKESFESGTAGWNSGGTNNDWAWGSPSKTVITGAGDGTKCWITGGLTVSFYNYGERSWLESPCYDFSSLSKPFLSFLLFWDTEYIYDGANLQYSIDGGSTWTTLGSANDPATCGEQNWYNYNRINGITQFGNAAGWCGTVASSSGSCRGGSGSGEWKRAAKCLSFLAGEAQVKFRFTFGSGTTCNDFDGFAFDDFTITEGGPVFAADFSFSCINSNTVSFADNSSACNIRWSWDFGDATSIVNTANATHQFAPGNYNVMLTTGGKCSNDTFISKQVRIMESELVVTPVSCNNGADGTISLVLVNGSGNETIAWSGIPSSGTTVTGLSAGQYDVTITDVNACTINQSAEIGYGPDAFPSVSLGNDTIICPGNTISLSAGSFPSYVWDDLSNDSIRIVNAGGSYSLEIENNSGCRATDTVFIAEDCLNDVLVPNAFTPNGDGMNDVFFVSGSETEFYRLMVFNRWGSLVFESTLREDGWNGQSHGKNAPEGIYIYKLFYKTFHSAERERTGSILVNY